MFRSRLYRLAGYGKDTVYQVLAYQMWVVSLMRHKVAQRDTPTVPRTHANIGL